jgi:predicted nucleotidyltransferase
MQRDEVLAILAAHRDEIHAQGVRSLSLFGAVARGEGSSDSEVDILVELEESAGLFTFAGVQAYLEELLARPVNLVTPGGIKQRELRDQILREAVHAA